MSTLRKILTKSEDGSIQIETSQDGSCELTLEGGETPFVLDEAVLIGTVVEYGQERGILAKPRQRKATKARKARKPRKDRGTSRTQPPPEDPGEPLPLAARVFEDKHGSQVPESHPDARPVA